jgi:hypothetical protein
MENIVKMMGERKYEVSQSFFIRRMLKKDIIFVADKNKFNYSFNLKKIHEYEEFNRNDIVMYNDIIVVPDDGRQE